MSQMTVYDEAQIRRLYSSSLRTAVRKLKEIKVFCGSEPSFSGLGGWVFEQTIQYCLRRELKVQKVEIEIAEQVKLKPRIKADLRVGKAVIEIKKSGLFAPSDIAKYSKYRKAANDVGLEYLFITGSESYSPYQARIIEALESENTFFLDKNGDWRRFVNRIVHLK
jgi:hypothetical protein